MKRLMILIGMVFASLVLIGSPCHGEENVIHGCYKKNNGQLRIVNNPSQCNPSEVPISWNQVGLQGPEGPQGEPGPPGAPGEGGLGVYSATEEYLGVLVDIDPYRSRANGTIYPPHVTVYNPDLDRLIRFGPSGTSAVNPHSWPSAWELYYETNDCTGTPYVYLGPSYDQDFYLHFVLYNHNLDSHWILNPYKQTINYQSYTIVDCHEYSGDIDVYEASEVVFPFTYPVSIPMMIENE
jgi:hypothetical protein